MEMDICYCYSLNNYSNSYIFAGMKIIGPVKASMISTLEPVVTLLFSFWILNESMDIYQMLGAFLIILAALILAK